MGACHGACHKEHVVPERQPRQRAGGTGTPRSVQPGDKDYVNPFEEPLNAVREEEIEVQTLSRLSNFEVPIIRKLQRVFEGISASKIKDGVIDLDEFGCAMGLDPSSAFCRALFLTFNKSKSQGLTFREFVVTLSMFTNRVPMEDRIVFSFDLFDLNKDGFIDLGELTALVTAAAQDKRVGVTLTPEQIEAVCKETIAEIDVDHNGKIDIDEYRKMVALRPTILHSFDLDIAECLGMRPTTRAQRMESIAVKQKALLLTEKKRAHRASSAQPEEHINVVQVTEVDNLDL